MAKFKAELPNDLIKVFDELETNAPIMMGEMCKAGATVVYDKVVSGLKKAFDPNKVDSLLKGLKITKVYQTPSDDGINVHVGFYGYDGEPTKRYPKGTPIPLKAMAREYGTSSGERKVSFLRPAFKKKDIEQAMMEVQKRYIEDDGNE